MNIKFSDVTRRNGLVFASILTIFLIACGGGGGSGESPSSVFKPELSLIAGDIGGPGNIDGVGTDARFDQIGALASDKAGNIYILDSSRRTVRKMTPDGAVTTLAGIPGEISVTPSIDEIVDGIGSSARFGYLRDITVDPGGAIYVIDGAGSYQIVRRVTPDGRVTTVAGNLTPPGSPDLSYTPSKDGSGTGAIFVSLTAISADANGDVYGIDGSTIRKITPAGVVTTPFTLSGTPLAEAGLANEIAVDRSGNLFLQGRRAIVKFSPNGTASTYLSDSSTGVDARSFWTMNNDANYNIYFTEETAQNTRVWKIDSLTGTLSVFAEESNPSNLPSTNPALQGIAALTADRNGDLIMEGFRTALYKVTASGSRTLIAGTFHIYGLPARDGTGQDATFTNMNDIAWSTAGELYVLDGTPTSIRKITSAGQVSTVATLALNQYQPSTQAAVDRSGNVYLSEISYYASIPRYGLTPHSVIRKIAQDGTVAKFSGPSGHETGYVDGPPEAARYFDPQGLVADKTNSLYVADSDNCVIRKLAPDGTASTFAGRRCDVATDRTILDGNLTTARFAKPMSLAMDGSGNLYVLDIDHAGNKISLRKIGGDGSVTTLAGGEAGYKDGTGAQAKFSYSTSAIAVGPDDNLYVTDSAYHSVRKVTQSGVASTVVRNGIGIRLGTSPSLYSPWGIAPLPPNALAIATPWSVLKLTIR